MAEAILKSKMPSWTIDSAGTGNWHAGELPDPRTRQILGENGIDPCSVARQVTADDFIKFEQVIAMDQANQRELTRMFGTRASDVVLLSSFDKNAVLMDVPDPYYGTQSDFDSLFVLLDKATDLLIENILN